METKDWGSLSAVHAEACDLNPTMNCICELGYLRKQLLLFTTEIWIVDDSKLTENDLKQLKHLFALPTDIVKAGE